MKVLRNDTVEVIAGKDRGKRGAVRAVLPKENRIVVENVNIYKRHLRRGRARQAGIVEFEAPLQVSNVMVICPTCDRGVRIGYEFTEDNVKIRVCKRCGTEIPRRVI